MHQEFIPHFSHPNDLDILVVHLCLDNMALTYAFHYHLGACIFLMQYRTKLVSHKFLVHGLHLGTSNRKFLCRHLYDLRSVVVHEFRQLFMGIMAIQR